jgi:hypothetical protein
MQRAGGRSRGMRAHGQTVIDQLPRAGRTAGSQPGCLIMLRHTYNVIARDCSQRLRAPAAVGWQADPLPAVVARAGQTQQFPPSCALTLRRSKAPARLAAATVSDSLVHQLQTTQSLAQCQRTEIDLRRAPALVGLARPSKPHCIGCSGPTQAGGRLVLPHQQVRPAGAAWRPGDGVLMMLRVLTRASCHLGCRAEPGT